MIVFAVIAFVLGQSAAPLVTVFCPNKAKLEAKIKGPSPIKCDDDPQTSGLLAAQSNFPDADILFAANAAKVLQKLSDENRVSSPRAMQRLGFDKVGELIGGLTASDAKTATLTALALYAPPRSGFVEAFGPAMDSVIPDFVPADADVVRVSARPSGVFSQANNAFAAADPVNQALFYTHLKGLEQEMGKRFADDALGTVPKAWTMYTKGTSAIAVLEVADVALVVKFLERYAVVVSAFAPNATVTRPTVGGQKGFAVIMPGTGTFAVGFTKSAIVLAQDEKSLAAHFAGKKGRAQTIGGSAIACGITSDTLTKGARVTWTMALEDKGLRFDGQAKARK
ncbi:MAG: hypothetical protein H7Z43_06770 [Clostridia bacterium]|nr:hypothetical protein [Deltaproteobacteria bacterium]